MHVCSNIYSISMSFDASAEFQMRALVIEIDDLSLCQAFQFMQARIDI